MGICSLYISLDRFFEAIQPLQDGIALISDGMFPGRCLWPGTSNVIAETDHSPADLKVWRADVCLRVGGLGVSR